MQKNHAAFGSRGTMLLTIAGAASLILPSFFGLAGASTGKAQQQPQATPAAAPVFEYEVASIKPNKTVNGDVSTRTPPDGFTATNIALKDLIESAFGVQNYQIIEAPEWLASEKFDIAAKMDPAVAEAFHKLNIEDRRLARQHMLQVLLADRIALKLHRETKELPIYSLVIGKTGPKLQETKPADPGPNAAPPTAAAGGPSVRNSRTSSGPATLTFLHTSSADLAATLAIELGRTVVDKTGLSSRYDFTLKFMPDTAQPQSSSASAPGDLPPSIFTAIQEQLGLKLESGKGPVEILVIDHVERPSGN
jgi:uncharacterized protein (TIGR03435 family)